MLSDRKRKSSNALLTKCYKLWDFGADAVDQARFFPPTAVRELYQIYLYALDYYSQSLLLVYPAHSERLEVLQPRYAAQYLKILELLEQLEAKYPIEHILELKKLMQSKVNHMYAVERALAHYCRNFTKCEDNLFVSVALGVYRFNNFRSTAGQLPVPRASLSPEPSSESIDKRYIENAAVLPDCLPAKGKSPRKIMPRVIEENLLIPTPAIINKRTTLLCYMPLLDRVLLMMQQKRNEYIDTLANEEFHAFKFNPNPVVKSFNNELEISFNAIKALAGNGPTSPLLIEQLDKCFFSCSLKKQGNESQARQILIELLRNIELYAQQLQSMCENSQVQFNKLDRQEMLKEEFEFNKPDKIQPGRFKACNQPTYEEYLAARAMFPQDTRFPKVDKTKFRLFTPLSYTPTYSDARKVHLWVAARVIMEAPNPKSIVADLIQAVIAEGDGITAQYEKFMDKTTKNKRHL